MTKSYPQIEIQIVGNTAAPLYAQVLNGELDAAIIMQPPFSIPKGCGWQLLREEPLIVLTPESASVRDPHVSLSSEPFIRLVRGGWAGRLIDGYLRQARIRPRERFELDTFEAIAVMVDRGLGVSLVPDWAPPWPEGLSLRKLAVPNRAFTRYIGLLWMRAALRAPLVHAFLEATETALAPAPNGALRRGRRSLGILANRVNQRFPRSKCSSLDSCVACGGGDPNGRFGSTTDIGILSLLSKFTPDFAFHFHEGFGSIPGHPLALRDHRRMT